MYRRKDTCVCVSISLLLLAMGGCLPAPPPENPIHTEIVLTADHPIDLSEYFREWDQSGALYQPGSQFRVLIVGNTRHETSIPFVATVPNSWGPNSLHAKGQFIQHGFDILRSPQLEEHHIPTKANTPYSEGITKLICPGRSFTAAGNDQPPHYAAVVLDISGGANLKMAQEFLYLSYDQWIQDSGVSVGSCFQVFITGATRETAQHVFALAVPSDMRRGSKLAYVLAGANELHSLALTSKKDSSAIIEAINLAHTRLKERPEPATRHLYVFSDLRQITKSKYAFEQAGIPDVDAFHSWLQDRSLWMDLDCPVFIAGIRHNGQTGHLYTAQDDAALRNLWQSTLEKMGSAEVVITSDLAVLFQDTYQGGSYVTAE